jgi:hypothetical protein
MWLQAREFKWGLSVNECSDVKCSDVTWYVLSNLVLKWSEAISFWSEVKWVTVKFLGTKVTWTLGWPYTEGTCLYCDYFIWCESCTVLALTCFVKCERVWACVCVCVWGGGGCKVWMCVCVGVLTVVLVLW